jgi:maltose alpha-D-glucosyltransferase / alpha-amylase
MDRDQAAPAEAASRIASDPQWYKDAIIYQLHIKSFFDGNNDGVGDFPGLIEKLDYIANLGVNAVWLLPFYPSPRRDDGYDISDYRGVHPEYGTVDDVKRFIAEAHARGIRVITELVINHTSDQHPWFQRARHAPAGSPERDYYVWSDTDKRYAGTRIIFLDTEKSNWTWDEEAKAYYWHRFYSHQPDLNFDNPAVFEECLAIMRYWLDMGVDGLRLDAVPYLVERESTNNENLPETHAILKRIRAEVDAHYPNRVLLAEANQWPEDIQQYFGDGDECQMLFHFPLMPRMYMALAQEDRFPITDIIRQTPDAPEGCQWATFLRNHDELTLEMVTDKERDYLWNTYASDRRARLNLGIRRRLAPLLERDFRRIMLMNSLLFTIGGTPVVYYGDEIGMGDNIHLGDRDGVRTPMQWTFDRNGGFSRADPAALVLPVIMDPLYGYEAVNVEAQLRDSHSLLNWLMRMLVIRGQHRSFGRGAARFLRPANRKILAYLRESQDEAVLCVANVSRTAQAVELDLSEFSGRTPVELSGNVPFPKIGQLTYMLTLPPYGFYWFLLSAGAEQPAWSAATSENFSELYTFVLREGIQGVMEGHFRSVLERDILPSYLAQRRWFQQKAHSAPGVSVKMAMALGENDRELVFTEIAAQSDGAPATYALPLAIAWEDEATSPQETPLALARVRRHARMGLLTDGFASPKFARAMLAALKAGAQFTSGGDTLVFEPALGLPGIEDDAEIQWLSVDQSNSTLAIGRALTVKLYRHLVDGIHPEVEMDRELTLRGFAGIAALMGEVAHVRADGSRATIAVVQRFVENQGDGFAWSLGQAKRFVDEPQSAQAPGAGLEVVANFIAVTGRRLGEMHRILNQKTDNPDFAPARATAKTVAAWQARCRAQLEAAFAMLQPVTSEEAQYVFAHRAEIAAAADAALSGGAGAVLTRIHGDLHLGQVLVAAGDAVFVDFEGEPLKPLSERRAKHSPLRDIAGMMRSFDYVAGTALRAALVPAGGQGREQAETLLASFAARASAAFLRGYGEGRGRALTAREKKLLDAFMLERAAYEILYEAENRPDWLAIPVHGFAALAARLAQAAP